MDEARTLEVCVDSIESALAAQKGGAHRIELCDNMQEGGTTPSIGTIALARRLCDIPIHVMIRPRGGGFCYSENEFEVMKMDIQHTKNLGADGIVFGVLKPDATIDMERCAEFAALARPMSITFHRAFDVVRDAAPSLEALIQLGVDRLLTSGQKPSALEGLSLVTELVKQARERIIIMPGAGITHQNISQIMRQAGVSDVHVYGAATVPVAMQSEDARRITDAGQVKSILAAMR